MSPHQGINDGIPKGARGFLAWDLQGVIRIRRYLRVDSYVGINDFRRIREGEDHLLPHHARLLSCVQAASRPLPGAPQVTVLYMLSDSPVPAL